MHDVIVIGAGLAGLAAARDLAAGGADVIVLEARARPGGCVEQTVLPDGRVLQLGGELVGEFHTAYLDLVAELGLATHMVSELHEGKAITLLNDGSVDVGHTPGWMDEADRGSYATAEKAFGELLRTIDPDDPWSHPDAERLDRTSVGAWLQSVGATPNVIRNEQLQAAWQGDGTIYQISLLSALRAEAAAGSTGFHDYGLWETRTVTAGSAAVALAMAEQLRGRIRYSSPVVAIDVGTPSCAVTTANGEWFEAEAVVCAVPVGPLRDISVAGVSAARMESLSRQRHARAAKAVFAYECSFWESSGHSGSSMTELGILGGTWQQGPGVLSSLVPPERFASLLSVSSDGVQDELIAELVRLFGASARHPVAVLIRRWGSDPYTQGYGMQWHPGDVLAVGRLHGTHEPPFYVCGADHWVAGYMEGAVRTGRAAAAAALAG